MARAAKRAKQGIGPAGMGEMRSNASIRDIMYPMLMEPLLNVGPGTEDPEKQTRFQIDLDEKNCLDQFVGIACHILAVDLKQPSPGTILKLEGLIELAKDCSKETEIKDLKPDFTKAARKLKSIHKYIRDFYLYQNPDAVEQARIYLYNFIVDFCDGLGYQPQFD